jgi:type III secretory pathway lipoprotein EscJ
VEGDDGEAKRALRSLQNAHIPAVVVEDGARSKVEVAIDDVPRAHRALEKTPPSPNQEAPFGRGSLLKTVDDEHLARTAKQEQALAALLGELPGISRATVRLALPSPVDAFGTPPKPHAAIVVVGDFGGSAGNSPKTQDAELKRFVAAAEPSLAPEDIEIVQKPLDLQGDSAPAYRLLGPFAVAPASVRPLRILLAALSGTVTLLAALMLWGYVRGRPLGPSDT